ncbi:hypothetical protein J0X19_05695 [Hymenobacter sp. BT186]|uniref:Uncharacterized protein n=1 Tax=Hymenobacter telluris TaxID=2816474 RepID=A0A939JBL8_9BACT|nr:hypothetical protein [Hymenobacter telluris]MBO0357430.1 hypothetical protein [Hymenobacter telluris]MBW3373456.1 hypothetical protein [Hymenobacter norwichensis]
MSDSATRPTTDEEWENLLAQWRTQQNNQPQPFFYSRVRARLVGEVSVEPQLLPAWLRWPSYAVLLGIILLLSGDGAMVRSVEPASHYQLQPDIQPVALPTR